MTDQCSTCEWNRVYILKLENKYDYILQLLTEQVALLQDELLELQSQMRIRE